MYDCEMQKALRELDEMLSELKRTPIAKQQDRILIGGDLQHEHIRDHSNNLNLTQYPNKIPIDNGDSRCLYTSSDGNAYQVHIYSGSIVITGSKCMKIVNNKILDRDVLCATAIGDVVYVLFTKILIRCDLQFNTFNLIDSETNLPYLFIVDSNVVFVSRDVANTCHINKCINGTITSAPLGLFTDVVIRGQVNLTELRLIMKSASDDYLIRIQSDLTFTQTKITDMISTYDSGITSGTKFNWAGYLFDDVCNVYQLDPNGLQITAHWNYGSGGVIRDYCYDDLHLYLLFADSMRTIVLGTSTWNDIVLPTSYDYQKIITVKCNLILNPAPVQYVLTTKLGKTYLMMIKDQTRIIREWNGIKYTAFVLYDRIIVK